MQSTTNPSPCAQPKTIVSVSNPGTSQKTISAAEDRQLDPGEPLDPDEHGPGTGLRTYAARGEGGEDDPLLLAARGRRSSPRPGWRGSGGRCSRARRPRAAMSGRRRDITFQRPCCAAPPGPRRSPSGSGRRRSARRAVPWRRGRAARPGRSRRSRPPRAARWRRCRSRPCRCRGRAARPSRGARRRSGRRG